VQARVGWADHAPARLRRICGAVTGVAADPRRREACAVDFKLLGPVEVWADGRPLAVAGARQRALLAVLLLHAGEPVSRERVILDLWGERPPAGAVKTVQAVVSRLRRAFGGEAARLVSGAAGYRLRVEPDELDLGRFERLCEDGRRALAAGSYARAAGRLGAALKEWRGPALADVAFEPFAAPEIARLEDLRAAAIEDRVEADLALGGGAALVGELEALVIQEPLRERLRGQLMLALYRAGRQGEALDAYREAARTLDAELGLHPGPELERLQQAILAHDPALLHRPPAQARPQVERRRATATILSAELGGAARIRARLGDADADAVHGAHERALRDALAAHAAIAVNALGDCLVAAFAAAGDALACAVEMQRAVDRQARRGPTLELRIGIGAGDVTWAGDEYSGAPVIEAMRLCDAAAAGRVLVADAVRLLAGPGMDAELEDAGELTLRDLVAPVRAWSVHWTAARTVAVPFPASLVVDDGAAFVGREAELAALRAAWADVSAGRRRGVFVSGEPGIGKTRLAAEIAAYAGERSGLVLYGRCDDGVAAAAQPFAQALGAYAAACPVDELRLELGSRAGDLLALLPELGTRVPGIDEPAPAEPEIERLRTLQAAAALLEAAGAAAPVLLVLDDVQWADDLSLLLLRHLLRCDAAMRLLVIAAYRDTEPSRSPLLAEVVTGLARRPDVARLELGPLAEPEVAAMLAHAGREPSLADRVRTATEGNPFFVGEIVRALGEDHDPQAALTPRVRDVVRWRLARLPAGTADVLSAAAVAGVEFDPDVVADTTGVALDRALDALEAAERARLVRASGILDRFSFAHALVRETIVDELPAGRRVRLHGRIAHALERAAARRPVSPGELAAHFAAAGTLVDPIQTVAYARAAGDEAATRLAFDVAAQQYERALRAHARLPSPPADERLDLELARGRALSLAGDQRAGPVLRGVATAAEAASDGARMAEALLSIRLDLEAASFASPTPFTTQAMLGVGVDVLEDNAEMIALLRRALALLPPGDCAIRARLKGFLAQEAWSSVSDHECRAMVGDALAMARRVGDPTALASVLTSHSWIVAGPESVPERLAIADELVTVGREAGLPYAECDGQEFRFFAHIERGDIIAADAALAAAHAAAHTVRSRSTVAVLDTARALIAGRLADAEAAAARSRDTAREATDSKRLAQGRFVRLLSCIRLLQGRLTDHEPARQAMAQAITTPSPTFFIVNAHTARERGDHDGVQDALERALARGLLEMPHGLTWAMTLTWAADICAWLQDRAVSARLLDQLAPFADVMICQSGPVGRGVGLLEQALGRPDQAQQRLRDSIALCERMDARAFLAVARLDLGTLLLPSAEGRRLVDQACAAADELGMPGLTRRAPAAHA
jgi:DNA-binding SARP family transcriptional activator